MPGRSLATQSVFLGPQRPIYPHVRQMVRTLGQVGLVYSAVVQQFDSVGMVFRDREPCYVYEPNAVILPNATYKGRLIGSYGGQPLYVVTVACCIKLPTGGEGDSSSSSSSGESSSSSVVSSSEVVSSLVSSEVVSSLVSSEVVSSLVSPASSEVVSSLVSPASSEVVSSLVSPASSEVVSSLVSPASSEVVSSLASSEVVSSLVSPASSAGLSSAASAVSSEFSLPSQEEVSTSSESSSLSSSVSVPSEVSSPTESSSSAVLPLTSDSSSGFGGPVTIDKCGPCDASPLGWSVTIGGTVYTGLCPGDPYNGTFTLAYFGLCIWNYDGSCGCNADGRGPNLVLGFNGASNDIQLSIVVDPDGSVVVYSLGYAEWNCLGQNVLVKTIDQSAGKCVTNWPATLTVTPV